MITARRIVFWVMAAQALMWCAAAFAWPAASSYWIDELFTLFVTDHAGGPAEVTPRIVLNRLFSKQEPNKVATLGGA